MIVWPNWVDLIILTIVWTTSYRGFARGLITEFLNVVAAGLVVVAAVSFWGVVAGWLERWIGLGSSVAAVVAFWVLLLSLWCGMRLIRRRLAQLLQWERVHRFIQGAALALGALRGLWWSGFLVLVLVSSQLPALQASVEERSVLGPRLLHGFQRSLEFVAGRVPGSQPRQANWVPPLAPLVPDR